MDPDASFLAELEELMRQEFFPQYVNGTIKVQDTIRLFQLKPGRHDEPLQGRLIYASFNSIPKYEALSYSWGNPDKLHHLLTDEGFVPITESVRSALTRLRFHDQIRVLWVDAICINQDDHEEKEEQILLMPKIYSSASRAVVYLGEEANGSDLAIKLIEKIAKTSFHGLPTKFVSETALANYGLPDGSDKVWKAFRAFWSRPWFRRVWIMQEFLLAENVTIICGKWEKDWEIFLDACNKISDLKLTHKGPGSQTDVDEVLRSAASAMAMLRLCLHRVARDRGRYNEGVYQSPAFQAIASRIKQDPGIAKRFSKLRQKKNFDRFAFFGIPRSESSIKVIEEFPLIKVLGLMRFGEATDPRDRLFSLLSLANDLSKEERQLLRPNYKEDVADTVCRYASVLVRKGDCMEILYDAFFDPSCSKIPSWVGDWLTPMLPTSLMVGIAAYWGSTYRAGGNSKEKSRMGEGEEGDVLIVSGGLVDTIYRIAFGPVVNRLSGPLLPMFANIALNDVDSIFDELSSYPTGESLFEVKWRTLIANTTAYGHNKAPGWYGTIYKTWRKQFKDKNFAQTDEALNEVAPKEFYPALSSVSNYIVCRTRGGYVGLAPTSAKVDDHICVLSGANVLFAIRDSIERPGMFWMIGGCYMHGMMNGEAFNFPHWQERELKLH